ncbi:SDR family NAD(P)-dependent oxidoreductase [Labrys wisconsinensis]|uniref:NAD(P)-dependent dehydrogenase (Short-subunit alcohol dehydrogenase family) n=1 Tax=Labrys wisconsinensis TaxID=425677 RepID=A0ABU0JGK6_9HYPH|nr:SDR family NAD(P)-dependent oxidoreductase [Labrys wisconsinensis]MDQ0473424.1 NAD(P)-dependent dehydrogenase (short-subunit alcohol dehydrogenase family) [Labrys wisconsinensis]
MTHPALTQGRAAVITGAASGIGLAMAEALARLGMKLALADVDAAALEKAAAGVATLAAQPADVIAVPTDVGRLEAVERLKDAAYGAFGEVALLMNNAGIEADGRLFAPRENWQRLIDVNLWGVVNGVQAFAPAMIAQGTPAAIVNTGSKQGITCPPGNTAYNVTKAGVKVVTEALAHELRNTPGCRVTAHLLVPGFTFTGFTRARVTEKPAGAWTPEQVIEFGLEAMGRGEFYILCPDNDVTRAMDERRIQWAADDIIANRPALSRWHPDFKDAFATFMDGTGPAR